ncbi:MAG: 30S ribosomal protein S6 [Syntrophales bacterium]|nr:30S ribosomal protein S6 [Syntrophales bacterium]
MRRYDVVFIAMANLSDAEISGIVERYQTMVTEHGGLIIKVEKWGKRKLAYDVRKQSMGFYVLFDMAGDSEIVDEMERNLKIDDKILKYLTVKTAEEITVEEVEEIIAAAVKAEEPVEEEKDGEATTEEDAAEEKTDAAPETEEEEK